MIALRRPNGFPVLLNPDLMQSAESSPDGHTIVTLTSGTTLVVSDSLESLQKTVLEFRRSVRQPAG